MPAFVRAQAELATLFARGGFTRVDPPILQPADIFLDVSGEELRRRLFLTSDPAGRELCLRPDLTIPTARLHLAGGAASREARYSYLGPVFRYRPGGTSEFLQAGAESFGGADAAAEDAAMLALAADAAAVFGVTRPTIRIGDVGLIQALVAALDLPPAWARRLQRGLSRGTAAGADELFGSSAGTGEHAALLGALAGMDAAKARAVVEDLLSIAGVAEVGGRSAEEIAARYLEQADLAGAQIGADMRDLITRFLAIRGTPPELVRALRALSDGAGLRLDAALEAFERRTRLLSARGLDVGRMEAATAFGRNLDYYTGFVFEIGDRERPETGTLAGGGRYDRLLMALGASGMVPAVGFSLWLDRLAGIRR